MLTAIKPKRRRVAIKEERLRAAVDAKRRRSRPAKTELAPRWSRRRRDVVRDVFDEDRRRRTGTLDGGGWVTLISAKGKGNDFRGVRFSELRNRRTSAQAGSTKRRARRSGRRLEKAAGVFSDVSRPFYNVDGGASTGASRFSPFFRTFLRSSASRAPFAPVLTFAPEFRRVGGQETKKRRRERLPFQPMVRTRPA